MHVPLMKLLDHPTMWLVAKQFGAPKCFNLIEFVLKRLEKEAASHFPPFIFRTSSIAHSVDPNEPTKMSWARIQRFFFPSDCRSATA